MSVFFKLVDFLTVINDMEKRGFQSKVLSNHLVDSVIMGTVDAYNKEFGAKPPMPPQEQLPTNDGNQTENQPTREENN